MQDGSIYLSRVAKSGDTYTDASEDTIMNRDMQDENLVNVSTTTSTVKQTEVVITLSTESSGKAPKQVIPKQILNEESVTIEMKNLNAFSDYYVYAKGQVIFATKGLWQQQFRAQMKIKVLSSEKICFMYGGVEKVRRRSRWKFLNKIQVERT